MGNKLWLYNKKLMGQEPRKLRIVTVSCTEEYQDTFLINLEDEKTDESFIVLVTGVTDEELVTLVRDSSGVAVDKISNLPLVKINVFILHYTDCLLTMTSSAGQTSTGLIHRLSLVYSDETDRIINDMVEHGYTYK